MENTQKIKKHRAVTLSGSPDFLSLRNRKKRAKIAFFTYVFCNTDIHDKLPPECK